MGVGTVIKRPILPGLLVPPPFSAPRILQGTRGVAGVEWLRLTSSTEETP
jgi:hypothetical protein